MYLKIFQKQYSIRQIDLGRGGGEGRGEEGGGGVLGGREGVERGGPH